VTYSQTLPHKISPFPARSKRVSHLISEIPGTDSSILIESGGKTTVRPPFIFSAPDGGKGCGLAFGEAVLMSSPPSRSQIGAGIKDQPLPKSGFGGWVMKRSKRGCGAAPTLSTKNLSTTFENISPAILNPDNPVILSKDLFPDLPVCGRHKGYNNTQVDWLFVLAVMRQ